MAEQQQQNDDAKKKQEQQLAAHDALNQFRRPHKPKNFRDGLGKGIGTIVGSAVGAAGTAVMLPVIGTTVGAKEGGVVGGIVGLAGGVTLGVIGGVGVAVGGVVQGVSDIGRGVVAGPKSVIALKQGKWWSDLRNEWVLTNLEEKSVAFADIPSDDSDILGAFEKDLDEKSSRHLGVEDKPKVADTYYYDVLDIDPAADAHAIKRRYYLLAREYHPDKVGPDNKEAADKFKDIAEAYQVLSDPELRTQYDKLGKAGLSGDKTSVAGTLQVDSALLFAHLFGSDKFKEYVGRFSMATSASIGDSNGISAKDAMELQHRRCIRIAFNLATKLQKYVNGHTVTEPKAWKEEAEELVKASYGVQLVQAIGKIYSLTAVYFLGSVESGIGLPNVNKWAHSHLAKWDQKMTNTKSLWSGMQGSMDMAKIQMDFKQKMAMAKTAEEEEQIKREAEEATKENMVEVLWTSAVVDITVTLWEATGMLFHDQSVDKDVRKKRAEGMQEMGKAWMETKPPEGAEEFDPKKLYEQAAEEAMLETIQRRDQRAHAE